MGANDVETCLNSALEKSITEDSSAPSEIEEVRIEVGRISVEPIGDEQVAWQVEATVVLEGGFELQAVIESEIVRVGRSVVIATTADTFGPLFPRDEVMAVMVDRLQAEDF